MIESGVAAGGAESDITDNRWPVSVRRELLGNSANGRAISDFISFLND